MSRLTALTGIIALSFLFTSGSARAGRAELADGAADCATAATCSLGDNQSNYETDGQYWHFNSSATNGSMPELSLNFGSGTQTNRAFVFDRAQGTVTFADGSYIDPLVISGAYNPSYTNNAIWSYGELAPVYRNTDGYHFGAFVYDTSTTLKAYRFDWTAQCPATANCLQNNPFLSFQALLIEFDPQTFLLELNYDNAGTTFDLTGASAQIKIGGYTATVPYNTPPGTLRTVGPDFCFQGGQLASCAAILGVPEPSELLLLVIGMPAVLLISRRRGRCRA